MLRICFAPRVAVGRVRNLEAYVFRSLGFSVARPERMFWQLLPASGDWRRSVQATSHRYRRMDGQEFVFR